MTPQPAACAVHPQQAAFLTCRRCGNFACEYCLVGGRELCEPCAERDEGGGVIAWERADLNPLLRLWRTIRQVLEQPGHTFQRLRPGSVGPALGYVAFVHALTSFLMGAMIGSVLLLELAGWLTPLSVPGRAGAVPLLGGILCGGPLIQTMMGLVGALALAGLYHAGVAILGGRGGFVASLRSVSYAQTIVLIWAPLPPIVLLPHIGPFVVAVAFAFQLAWGGAILTSIARTQHGLRGGLAALAGWWLPTLTALVLIGLVAGALALRDAATPSRAPDRYGAVSATSLQRAA